MRPQRDQLRFCKAFFEVRDLPRTRRLLERTGMVRVGGPEEPAAGQPILYWWAGALTAASKSGFTARLTPKRLVLEGATAESIGRGWRQLADALDGAAAPRVAAGDDLSRFAATPQRKSADYPETMGPEYQRAILSEFYSAFCQRWAHTPHRLLGGKTPSEATLDPALQPILASLLHSLELVENARRERGHNSFSVAELRITLGLTRHERH